MLYHLLYEYLGGSSIFFNVFRYITFRTIYATITALLIVLLLAPWFIEKLRSLSFKERISEYNPEGHKGKSGTPTMGGIMIVGTILLATLLWADLKNVYVWLGTFIMLGYAALGFIDDYAKVVKGNMKGLPPKLRLLVEFVLAGGVAYVLWQMPSFETTVALPFFKNIQPDLGLFYIPFVMLVIVGCANAVNLTDGLDGLAIGPATIAAATYLVFAYVSGNYNSSHYLQIPFIHGAGEICVLLGAMLGAGLGFLWYNTYPAQVFMGDVGSLSLGGLLGTVAVMTKQEILLLIVGGIFVMEAVSVIMQVGYFKLTHGKRIFRMAPIHHHFELKGWAEPKIIVRFWIISIFLALVAISTLKLR
ncbi:MAG: Phospho-N-acetylmuramoyl-pentapeptide-transferase [Deltaproteobacteria bacterium ADurb.Bin510]|nr:MAG: Phospho-N-acetylmuramoyl-pentapeptide-transferase [Deltaproteobacteria bacterium ADurb.Bin510]